MRSNKILYMSLFMAILIFIPLIANAVPNIITYQGKLNDLNGVPVTGDYTITFTIYDDPVAGNALWTETWTDTQKVSVNKGLFQVELGSINSLSPTIFDKDNLYLGIKVESDSEMTPRQKFTSGAYAFRSAPVTPILLHQSSRFQFDPVYKNNWEQMYSVMVPAGEIWTIYSLWGSSGPFAHDEVWEISALKLVIDGEEHVPSTSASNLVLNSGGSLSSVHGLFNPPIKAYAGQAISILGYTYVNSYYCTYWSSTPTSCTHNQYVKFGLFYYKDTP